MRSESLVSAKRCTQQEVSISSARRAQIDGASRVRAGRTTAILSSGVMIHSSFLGATSISSGSPSLTASDGAAFLPGPPLAHGESLALKRPAAAGLIERAKRRMSSV